MKLFAKNWFPVVVWAAIIFYLSSQPDLKISEGLADLILRKIAHTAEFGVLTFLIFRAVKNTFNASVRSSLVLSAVSVILYAVSDEIHQMYVPTRHGALSDVLIDGIGIVIAMLLIKQKVD